MQTVIRSICEKESRTQGDDNLDDFMRTITTGFDDSLEGFMPMPNQTANFASAFLPDMSVATGTATLPNPTLELHTGGDGSTSSHNEAGGSPETTRLSEGGVGPKNEVHPYDRCDQCDYRPKGDPKWFKGSLAKHKKLQHSTEPPKIYRCPYPGCTSQYKNRPDNLKQHQYDKGHFVEGEGDTRPSKRKKTE